MSLLFWKNKLLKWNYEIALQKTHYPWLLTSHHLLSFCSLVDCSIWQSDSNLEWEFSFFERNDMWRLLIWNSKNRDSSTTMVIFWILGDIEIKMSVTKYIWIAIRKNYYPVAGHSMKQWKEKTAFMNSIWII